MKITRGSNVYSQNFTRPARKFLRADKDGVGKKKKPRSITSIALLVQANASPSSTLSLLF